ncbi:hypothetical protein CP973_33005 [Streptomyces albofaciens JCM 4342]|nr:hypothetical protein CP973_33005 [Streptomyces albofaciens JCM 4342]
MARLSRTVEAGVVRGCFGAWVLGLVADDLRAVGAAVVVRWVGRSIGAPWAVQTRVVRRAVGARLLGGVLDGAAAVGATVGL